MIAITSAYDENGKAISLTDAAENHFKNLITGKSNYKSPLSLLKAEAKTGIIKKEYEEFLLKVSDEKEFKKLVVCEFNKLPSIIIDYKEYNTFFQDDKNKIERDKVIELFSYERFRKNNRGYKFAKSINIKTCPFCNNHFTLIRSASKMVDCDFDHFYSKKKYPYLSVSFFNLIPCCHVCNISKSDGDISKLVNPYVDNFFNKFKFTSDKETIIKFILNGSRDFSGLKIDTIPESGYADILEEHNKVFHINEIHQEHKDIVFEIYAKAYKYPTSRKKELKKLFEKKFFSNEEIERFVLGNYVMPEDINKRPLSKFMQDIAKEAGLISKT
ncbi:MAG TPA: hypothetical protein DEA97_03915 [Bacteroidales bacterium]|nr:MAG: hypothetical protein UR43_C0016G0012 [candidate division TM6 bacterium GW2011_GWF2_33_332]HBS85676.1 hypothetical protein [Bacteroidales bacterium]